MFRLIKMLTLLNQGPTVMTSFNRNYSLEALPPNTATLGVRTSAHEFMERATSQSVTAGVETSH